MFHDELYRRPASRCALVGGRDVCGVDLGCAGGHLGPGAASRKVRRTKGRDLSRGGARARAEISPPRLPLHSGEGDLRAALRKGDGNSTFIFSGFTCIISPRRSARKSCAAIRRRLAPGGLVLPSTSVRDESAGREQWLDHYCGWDRARVAAIPADGLKAIVETHPGHDQPELERNTPRRARRRFNRCRELHRWPLARALGCEDISARRAGTHDPHAHEVTA